MKICLNNIVVASAEEESGKKWIKQRFETFTRNLNVPLCGEPTLMQLAVAEKVY
jgi:hypothetical protein